MTDPSIARCRANGASDVLYRHSKTGETVLAKPGECLPRRKGDGGWYALACDNVHPNARQPIVMGRGLMWIAHGGSVQQGDEINIVCTMSDDVRGNNPRMGRYRVTDSKLTTWRSKVGVHIQIQHVGEMDLTKLVYVAGLANV